MKYFVPNSDHHKLSLNRTRPIQQKIPHCHYIIYYLPLASASNSAEKAGTSGIPVPDCPGRAKLVSCHWVTYSAAVGLQELFALWIRKPQPSLSCVNSHSKGRILRDSPAHRSYWAVSPWTGLSWVLFSQFIVFAWKYKPWLERCETPRYFCLTCCSSKEVQQLSSGWDDWLEVIFPQVTFAIITWCFTCLGGNNQHDLQKNPWKAALAKTIIWASYYASSWYSWKWGECTAGMGAAGCCQKDKQSREGEVVNSREIRFPSEIRCLLNVCFSLPGCRWWKNQSKWLENQIYCTGWSKAGDLTPCSILWKNFFWYPLIPDFTASAETSNYLPFFLTWGQDFLHAPPSCGPESSPFIPWWNCTAFWCMILWGQCPLLSRPVTQPGHLGAPPLLQPAANVGSSVRFQSSSMPVAAQVWLFWSRSSFK